MRVNDLLNFYRSDPRSQLVKAAWTEEASKTELKGIVGSATTMLASALMHSSEDSSSSHSGSSNSEDHEPSHLFILDDKESAAYFLNDLEQLIGDTHRVLFFQDQRGSPTKKR